MSSNIQMAILLSSAVLSLPYIINKLVSIDNSQEPVGTVTNLERHIVDSS